MSSTDKSYMKEALHLAARAKDKTYPNPMVGAIIVKGKKIVGRGYHKKAGLAHAEVEALKDAGVKARGATMFVTLEPCDHYGKTPPCTDLIISSGIKTVKTAMKDPNPINSGKGIKKLKKAGIKVKTGLCEARAKDLNYKYINYITKKRPYVTIKVAESLDGKIAACDGSSKWISSGISRRFVKSMRNSFDCIIVGVNTVIEDDPLLLSQKDKTSRTARIVIDSKLRTPIDSRIVKTVRRSPVIICTTGLAPKSKIKKFENKGVELIVAKHKRGKVSLKDALSELYERNMVNALVEGGGELIGGFLDEGLINEVMIFIAPKILGGSYSSIKGRGVKNIKKALSLENIEIKSMGPDLLVTGMIKQ